MGYVSDKRLYLNADKTKVVEEGSDQAAYLLVGEGSEIPEVEAKKYGLDKKLQTSEEAGAVEIDPESVARHEGQPEAKAQEPAEDKAAKSPRQGKSGA